MKFLAIFLTIALFGVMSWLIIDSRNQATALKNEFELLRRQQTPAAGSIPPTVQHDQEIAALESQILALQASRQASAVGLPSSSDPAPAPITLPPAMAAPIPATQAAPPPLTPRQRQVQAAPALGKVIEYQQEYGFVVITGGSALKIEPGMTFAIRRGPSIVGRIKVTTVDEGSTIADVVSGSVPAGVTIQIADDIIQDLP